MLGNPNIKKSPLYMKVSWVIGLSPVIIHFTIMGLSLTKTIHSWGTPFLLWKPPHHCISPLLLRSTPRGTQHAGLPELIPDGPKHPVVHVGTSWELHWPEASAAVQQAGWWARGKPPLKNMSSSVGMMRFPISGKIIQMATKPPTSRDVKLQNRFEDGIGPRNISGYDERS